MIYIVLLLVVGFFGWSYINARARINYANKRQALRKIDAMQRSGTLPPDCYPSWMPNKNRINEFVAMLFAETLRQGVPESFLTEVMSNQNYRAKLMLLAGTMEGLGACFEEQAMAASDMVIGTWNNSRNY